RKELPKKGAGQMVGRQKRQGRYRRQGLPRHRSLDVAPRPAAGDGHFHCQPGRRGTRPRGTFSPATPDSKSCQRRFLFAISGDWTYDYSDSGVRMGTVSSPDETTMTVPVDWIRL